MAKPRASSLVLIILLLAAAAAAAAFYLAQTQEHAKRVWAEDQLERVTKAKEALEQQLTGANQKAQELADQVAQEKRAREALTSELADSRSELDDARQEATESRERLEAERRAKLGLTEDLAKAKQSYQALNNELTTLRQAKEALEKRVKEMLAARAREAEKIVVTPQSAPAPAPGSMQGKVLVVNREFNFIVLNLGAKDGVKPGSRFTVMRGNKPVGTAEVEKLYDNMAAANLVQEEKKGEVKEGDLVRLTP